MFWIIIISILLFTFRDEIVSRFVFDEDNRRVGKLWLVIGIVLLLVISCLVHYCVRNTKVITLEDAEQIVVTELQTPVVANDIVVPDGYELIPLTVVDACFVCKDCGTQKSKPGWHNPDRKVITFQNGRKVTFWKDSQDYKNWASVGKGDICSYIKKVDEQGVLVKDMLLPVAPEFVCFDTEKGTVSYRN